MTTFKEGPGAFPYYAVYQTKRYPQREAVSQIISPYAMKSFRYKADNQHLGLHLEGNWALVQLMHQWCPSQIPLWFLLPLIVVSGWTGSRDWKHFFSSFLYGQYPKRFTVLGWRGLPGEMSCHATGLGQLRPRVLAPLWLRRFCSHQIASELWCDKQAHAVVRLLATPQGMAQNNPKGRGGQVVWEVEGEEVPGFGRIDAQGREESSQEWLGSEWVLS